MGWQGYAVCSALFAAMVALLSKAGLKGVDSDWAVAVRTTVVLVMAWGLVVFKGGGEGIRGAWASMPGRSLAFLLLSGVATGLSWLCYFRALDMGEALRVAPIDKLSVVFTTVLAAVFLGETLTWAKAAGVGLIAAGALVLLKSDPPHKPEPAVRQEVDASEPSS